MELAIAKATSDDTPAAADALHGLGWVLLQQGENERAKDVLEQDLALCRRLGDAFRLAKGLNAVGLAWRNLGHLDVAWRLLEESLELARGYPEDALLGNVLNHLAIVALDRGDPEHAMALFEECILLASRQGDSQSAADRRINLAAAIGRAGRPAEAHDLLSSLVDDIVGLGDVNGLAGAFDELAETALALGADVRAARLMGAADRLREQIGIPRTAPDARHLERSVGPGRDRVGHGAWDAEVGAGRQLTQDEALALAREPHHP